jgi:toxin ParE1/3/4
MTVDYTKRAIADLLNIATHYEGTGNPGVGQRIAARIDEVVARIAAHPRSGRTVANQQGLRVVPLLRFPYVIFYEITAPGTIQILHIRHAARRPWGHQ